jgi:uncharacterized membrane protein
VKETKARSFAKAVSYRIVSSLITGGLVFGATRRGGLAVGVAGVESAVKVFNYFLHERLWGLIAFGRFENADGKSDWRNSNSEEELERLKEKLQTPGHTQRFGESN